MVIYILPLFQPSPTEPEVALPFISNVMHVTGRITLKEIIIVFSAFCECLQEAFNV